MWLAETEWNAENIVSLLLIVFREKDIRQEIKNDVEGFQFIPSTKVNNFGNQWEKAKLFNSLNLISGPRLEHTVRWERTNCFKIITDFNREDSYRFR